MIVDDVFTNGDTKEPIAKMLKERGHQKFILV